MGFNCGIVGLPNVGKSTIFNALTRGKAQAANYPFCTIDPNVGIVPVNDPRLKQISQIVPTQKEVMTTVEIVDIAGLVKGAAEGEGLGNQFLSHIGATDAILQVVRLFEDKDVTHVMGGINPRQDVDTIQTELILKDIEIVTKSKERNSKSLKSGDKEAKIKDGWLEKFLAHLNEGKPLRRLELESEELVFARELNLITMKPVLYVGNVSEDQVNVTDSEEFQELQKIAKEDLSSVVVISGKIEEEISQLEEEERKEYLQTMGLDEPGLDKLVRAGYDLLGLITFFTAGEKENRAWTVEAESTAPQAAGKIHSDFERGFIRAEVIGFDDFIECKGEVGAKNAGKLRIEGKEYIVQDGDVMHFRFNV